MRIAESTIKMYSGRSFSRSGMRANGEAAGESYTDMASKIEKKDGCISGKDSYEPGLLDSGMSSYNMDDITSFRGIGKTGAAAGVTGNMTPMQFQNDLLAKLFYRFSSFGAFGTGGFSQNFVTYQEFEETAFQASGRAVTEDGRTIDFDISLYMSRSYTEYMNVSFPAVKNALFDPLVVNVGSEIADIKDQTFRFDIDCDGIEDEISMFSKGTGLLALDKNDNGKIDDGNELFGTKSGDGFADLREYDSDGNGWIDENDEIFEKLKIWCKDDDGNDILMNLKEADIGAIYLGEQQTEFTMGGADGVRDGVIRSTGLFLRESGTVGTIQHVDLAIKEKGQETEASGERVIAFETVGNNGVDRQSFSSRMQERRLKNERAMKEKDDKKQDITARLKKILERKKELDSLREKHLQETKEARDELMDSRIKVLLSEQEEERELLTEQAEAVKEDGAPSEEGVAI